MADIFNFFLGYLKFLFFLVYDCIWHCPAPRKGPEKLQFPRVLGQFPKVSAQFPRDSAPVKFPDLL